MSDKNKTTETPEQETLEPVTHIGFGKYQIVGTDIVVEGKKNALARLEELKAAAAAADEISDLIPEGVKIHEHNLIYRNSLMEVPMNEPYLPDGSISPYYDREWYWSWAADRQVSLGRARANRNELVTYKQIEEMVEAGKIPAHYLSVLYDHGTYVTYGDSVLVRKPRVLWRQQQREQWEYNRKAFERTEKSNRDSFSNANMPVISNAHTQNELKIEFVQ